MVLGRNANSSSTRSYDQSKLTIGTADKVCNRTRQRSMPSNFYAHLCLSSPQLVDNLATASKVVELVDSRTHCLLRTAFVAMESACTVNVVVC